MGNQKSRVSKRPFNALSSSWCPWADEDLDKNADVISRPGGYKDATATYIHRVKIPSHIHAKHQYNQESEYKSRGVLYIPT